MTLKYWIILGAAACLLAMMTNRRRDGGIAAGVERALAGGAPDDERAGLGPVSDIGRRMPANTLSPASNPFAGVAGPARSDDLHSPAATVAARSPIARGR